ncbi:peptidylprolyl isomerase [Stakelama sediminis]
MRFVAKILVALLLVLGGAVSALAQTAAPQAVPTPTPSPSPTPDATPTPKPGEVWVRIDTTAGPMVVAADVKDAPITAKNFLHYVDTKRFDGRKFYRVVKVDKEYGFVQFGMQGNPKLDFPPIKHEPTTETGLHHTDGTLSIARLKPGSARGEFTIVVGDQRASFDAHPDKPGDNLGYAAFGHIVSGRDVLIRILDSTIAPDKTDRGAFKGEMPADPVTIISARRVKPSDSE